MLYKNWKSKDLLVSMQYRHSPGSAFLQQSVSPLFGTVRVFSSCPVLLDLWMWLVGSAVNDSPFGYAAEDRRRVSSERRVSNLRRLPSLEKIDSSSFCANAQRRGGGEVETSGGEIVCRVTLGCRCGAVQRTLRSRRRRSPFA